MKTDYWYWCQCWCWWWENEQMNLRLDFDFDFVLFESENDFDFELFESENDWRHCGFQYVSSSHARKEHCPSFFFKITLHSICFVFVCVCTVDVYVVIFISILRINQGLTLGKLIWFWWHLIFRGRLEIVFCQISSIISKYFVNYFQISLITSNFP